MGQVIGIIGTGSTDLQSARDLLETVVDEDTHVILALTERHWTPTMQGVVQFLVDLMDCEYEVVVDESSMKVKELTPYIQGASRVHKVQRIPHKIVNLLTKHPESYLLMLWNDEDHEDMMALERATEKDIAVFNLCDGFDVLEFTDEPELPALGLQNLLAVTKSVRLDSDEEDEEEMYDEGTLVVLSKEEFCDLLQQAIVNALKEFRNGL